jgi:hypothetical protein
VIGHFHTRALGLGAFGRRGSRGSRIRGNTSGIAEGVAEEVRRSAADTIVELEVEVSIDLQVLRGLAEHAIEDRIDRPDHITGLGAVLAWVLDDRHQPLAAHPGIAGAPQVLFELFDPRGRRIRATTRARPAQPTHHDQR